MLSALRSLCEGTNAERLVTFKVMGSQLLCLEMFLESFPSPDTASFMFTTVSGSFTSGLRPGSGVLWGTNLVLLTVAGTSPSLSLCLSSLEEQKFPMGEELAEKKSRILFNACGVSYVSLIYGDLRACVMLSIGSEV